MILPIWEDHWEKIYINTKWQFRNGIIIFFLNNFYLCFISEPTFKADQEKDKDGKSTEQTTKTAPPKAPRSVSPPVENNKAAKIKDEVSLPGKIYIQLLHISHNASALEANIWVLVM